MKLWGKFLLIFFVIILLGQIPFIFNLYQFSRLANKINSLQNERIEKANPNFNDFKGIIHAHTALGGHSTGSLADIINASAENNLDFVVMTEHPFDQMPWIISNPIYVR